MIKPICYKCCKELDRPGGILLSPPSIKFLDDIKQVESDHVFKFHLCVSCYSKVFVYISNE